MNKSLVPTQRYALAGCAGALAGGIFVLAVTKAVPRMISQIMPGMMQKMMAQMQESGWEPSEI